MSTIDDVMQAAERLTRIFEGGENAVAVYREAFPESPNWTDSPWLNGKYVEECLMATDYENIADAVRPKGKRPVAIEQPDGREQTGGAKNPAWIINGFGEVELVECCCTGCYPRISGVVFYATKDDASEVRREHLFRELVAMAR